MRFRPLFYASCKLQLRRELRKQNRLYLLEFVDTELIDSAAPSTLHQAIGDGSLFERIVEWLRSDEGKAFIKLLLSILITLVLEEQPDV